MATNSIAPSTMMPTTDGGSPLVGIETGSLSILNEGGAPEARDPGGAEDRPVSGFTAPTMVCPTRSRRDSRVASSLAVASASYGRWVTAGARTVEINLEPTMGAQMFDEGVYGPATQAVPAFFASL